jgi:hypothetical protein
MIVVGSHEAGKVRPEFVMALIAEALNGGFLEGAVHPLDLAVGPPVVRFGKPVLDVVCLASHVEAHLTRPGGVTFARLFGELDASLRIDPPDQSAAVGVGQIVWMR